MSQLFNFDSGRLKQFGRKITEEINANFKNDTYSAHECIFSKCPVLKLDENFYDVVKVFIYLLYKNAEF